MQPSLPPCLVCEKAVVYLWPEHQDASNLNSACDVRIYGGYGSDFDLAVYHAVICDACMDKAIQSRRVNLHREYLI